MMAVLQDICVDMKFFEIFHTAEVLVVENGCLDCLVVMLAVSTRG